MEAVLVELPEECDAIAIGSGMGGLAAAVRLAQEGLRVILLEKHSRLGGYVQFFGRDPVFDSAHHFIAGLGPGTVGHALLGRLEVLDRIELVRLEPAFRLVSAHDYFDFAGNAEADIKAVAERSPNEADAIWRAADLLADLGAQELSGEGHGQACTVSEELRRFDLSREATEYLTALWPLLGLPPSRLSARTLGMWWYLLEGRAAPGTSMQRAGGAYYPIGGAKAFALAFGERLEELEGKYALRTPVAGITTDGRRVSGVRLEDGREIRCRWVISNADPYRTHRELLGGTSLPSDLTRKLDTWEVANAGIVVHLGVNQRLALRAHTHVVHYSDDYEASYADLMSQEPRFDSLVMSSPTHSDPARAAENQSLVFLHALAPGERRDAWGAPPEQRPGRGYRQLQSYQELKAALGQRLREKASLVVPELAGEGFEFKVGTPLTMNWYTFNERGSAHGWANTPEQTGPGRGGPRTHLPGLYQAGHWCAPGTGVVPSLLSGMRAAEAVLEDAG